MFPPAAPPAKKVITILINSIDSEADKKLVRIGSKSGNQSEPNSHMGTKRALMNLFVLGRISKAAPEAD